jgi:hypothetical protein
MSDENSVSSSSPNANTAYEHADESQFPPMDKAHGAKRGSKRSRSLADASETTSTRQSLGAPGDSTQSSLEQRTSSLFDGLKASDATTADNNNNSTTGMLFSRQGRRTSMPSNSSFSSRSQLFPESDPSLVAPATLLGNINGDSTNSETPKMAGGRKSFSLFGSVMKNVQELSHPQAQAQPPTTPKQLNNRFSASPGGFQLLDFVNNAVNSPFHFPGSSPQADSAASTPRRNVEWHETFVGSNMTGLVDWSLKKGLTFECQPGLSLVADVNAQRLGMMQFMSGLDSKPNMARNRNDSSAAAAQWEAGLLFWQHPALYPLPAAMEPSGNRQFAAPAVPLMNNASDSLLSKDSGAKSQMDGQHSKLGTNFAYDLAQATMPPPKASFLQPVMSTAATGAAAGKRSGLDPGSNDARAFMERRKCEWQEAFRSLYLSWIQAVRRLADKWDDEDVPKESDIADTYFYACGKGHTILFRVGIHQSNDDDDDDNLDTEERNRPEVKLVPEIVISSSTRQTREKLRSMGVKLVLLERWEDAEGEFHENIIQPEHANEHTGADASPAVKEELAALRRAQVYGQTVGADVKVTTKPRATMRFRSPKGIPPLVVSGEDECAAFFEVYLNSLGQIGFGTPQAWHASDLPFDVPRLLCRKLGPFLHSSMQSLDLKKKRSNAMAKSDGSLDEHVSIELRGILLPCAVRDLVCAVINGMLVSETQSNSSSDDSSKVNADSQNLIVRANAFDGEELQAIQGTIGSHSSVWLNGKADFWGHLQEGYEDGKTVQQCRYGEVLMMAVWDSTRPSALAYKLDYIASTLLG